MALKFLNASAQGPLSGAVNSFEYISMMRSRGVNIRATSNSWIDDNYSSVLKDAINGNRNLGILCVCAAGNSVGNIDHTPYYPACYDLDNIFSVVGGRLNVYKSLYNVLPHVIIGIK